MKVIKKVLTAVLLIAAGSAGTLLLTHETCSCEKCSHNSSCTIPAPKQIQPTSQPAKPFIMLDKWEVIAAAFELNRKYTIIPAPESEMDKLIMLQAASEAMLPSLNDNSGIDLENIAHFLFYYFQEVSENVYNISQQPEEFPCVSKIAMRRLNTCTQALDGEINSSIPTPLRKILLDELQGLVNMLSDKEALERDGYLPFAEEIEELCKTARTQIAKLKAINNSKDKKVLKKPM